jgi:hypothetical protein
MPNPEQLRIIRWCSTIEVGRSMYDLMSRCRRTTDRDAEAIAEAATWPTMRFVELKSESQLDMQTLHRARDLLVGERTALIEPLRVYRSGSLPAPSLRWGRPLRVWRISGSRLSVWFLVELGAAMIVASTIVPPLQSA